MKITPKYRKYIVFFFLLLLTLDFGYSFLQYYHTPLDGDMAGGIVFEPDKNGVQEIFNDPFGIKAVVNQTKHPNPNRYFAHLFFKEYFITIPVFLQKFTSPVTGVYLAAAIIKLIIHIGIVLSLAKIINFNHSVFSIHTLGTALLITPLFQAYGYSSYMGIIDKSVTYTFFYALPMCLLLLYVIGVCKLIQENSWIKQAFLTLALFILSIILPFSGPLIPPVILIAAVLITVYYVFAKKYNSHKFLKRNVTVLLLFITLLSLYSLYLGTYNSTYVSNIPSIAERYSRLPMGIYYQFTQKLGFPLLFLMLIINILMIKKYYPSDTISDAFKWLLIFSVTYILLLPLGGYRPYRPNILRFDTIMPVTIALFYVYALSTYFIFTRKTINKKAYLGLQIIFLLIFTNADKSGLNENNCEKQALNVIAESKSNVVELDVDCTILSWEKITNPQDSRLNAKLLKLWNITPEIKLYYQTEK